MTQSAHYAKIREIEGVLGTFWLKVEYLIPILQNVFWQKQPQKRVLTETTTTLL